MSDEHEVSEYTRQAIERAEETKRRFTSECVLRIPELNVEDDDEFEDWIEFLRDLEQPSWSTRGVVCALGWRIRPRPYDLVEDQDRMRVLGCRSTLQTPGCSRPLVEAGG
jgi:hypothetical protein